MDNPYQVLEVAATADDAAIKKAYLQMVRENPPEREQEKFQRIHEAYEQIKNKKRRLAYELFTLPNADFDAFLDQTFVPERTSQLGSEQLLLLLREGLDKDALLKNYGTGKR